MNDDEIARWFGGVKPLKRNDVQPDFARAPKQKNFRRIAASERLLQPTVVEHRALNLAPLSEAHFRQFCAEKVFIHREMDLHGWFVDEALRYVQDALEEQCSMQWQHWRIIHGKGRAGESPLKIAIWQMLQQHRAVAALAPIWDSRGESGGLLLALYPQKKRF